MELLAAQEDRLPRTPAPLARGTRRLRIGHELLLFQPAAADRSIHKVIPPGGYDVEEILHRQRRWLKLAGEDWGNAEPCWEAVLETERPAPIPRKRGILWQIARAHQAVSAALKTRPRLHSQAEADKLLKEASQHIRRQDWQAALPLLQKASACDAERYEIVYRWVQAVRHAADDRATAVAVKKALAQSQWSAERKRNAPPVAAPRCPEQIGTLEQTASTQFPVAAVCDRRYNQPSRWGETLSSRNSISWKEVTARQSLALPSVIDATHFSVLRQ